MRMPPSALSGLELLASAVVLLDESLVFKYANSAAENLFEFSTKNLEGYELKRVFQDNAELSAALDYAATHNRSYTEHDLAVETGHGTLHLSCTVTPVEVDRQHCLLLEFRPIDQQLKIAREQRL